MTPNKLSLLFLQIVLYILFPFFGHSQTLPPHQLTVYDSTVTGYYFFATKKSSADVSGQAGYIHKQIVLDHLGNIIYYHAIDGGDFTVQPNGQITCARGGKWMILDSTFTPVDSVACIGYQTDSHEIQILSNHYYLLLGLQDSIMDLSAYHYFKHNGTPGSSTALVTGSVIQGLDSNKNLVFQWRTLEHLPFNSVDSFFMFKPDTVDWTHSNALQMDTDGNILMSTRHFNEITKINRTTGAVMWRLGGKYNQFTFVNDPFNFCGQHDIRRIANGHITFLDNGHYYTSHGARGVEYQLDEVNKTATLVWSYTYDPALWSGGAGNTQRISGGLTLVNNGHRAFGHHSFSLVDSLNNQISEMQFFDTTVLYRVFFYRTLPWSFHRPQITCDIQGTNTYLKTTTPYASYLWSTGDTTATIQITTTGTYHVMVNYGEGFIVSEDFIVANLSNPCYPAPSAGFIANTTSVCKNATIIFTDQTANTPTSWQWSFPGGTPSNSTLKNPHIQYMTAGTYSVTLIAGNASGYGSTTKTNYITVNSSSVAAITANGPLNYCTAGFLALSANTGTGLSYQWQKGGINISGATSSTYTVASMGYYKVIVTNQNGCTRNSNTLSITGPPSVTITTTGSLDLCPGDSVKFQVPLASGNLYQWKENNANIAGATSHIYYASDSGIYKIRVTNSFGCSKLSVTKTVTNHCLPFGLSRKSYDQIKIEPNPSSDYFNVNLMSNYSYEIRIYDLSGKNIENYTVDNVDNFEIGKNLEPGFYLCEIFYENKKDFFKIIKAGR